MTYHVDSMVDDYVLDLLQASERQRLEHHARDCARCRALLAAESDRTRRVAAEWRSLSAPMPDRLEALWPRVAVAAGLEGARASAGSWSQWRAAFATFAVALALLAGIVGTVRRFDGWIMGTLTPTAAATHTSFTPTVSATPTIPEPGETPGGFSAGEIAVHSAVPHGNVQVTTWGTPEPDWVPNLPPQPRPNPLGDTNAP